MISLKELGIQAQTSLEFLVVGSAVILTFFMGLAVLFHGFSTIMAMRWAAATSRCYVAETNPSLCSLKTKQALHNHFGFHDIQIHTKIIRGIIHTDIKAKQLGQWIISGSYDLEPSEYKRVSHGQ
jgi:hypothetical protein